MLALTASAALAGHLNLSWGPECASDALVTNKNFACDTNSGSSTMVVSFVPANTHARLLGADVVITGATCADPVITNWWQFKNTGACRISALSANTLISGSAMGCLDAWGGQGTATIDYYGDPVLIAIPVPPVQGNRVYIKVGCSVPTEVALGVEEGREYFLCNVVVNHANTVGPGSCTGCLDPMIWGLRSIMLGYQDRTEPPVFTSEQIGEPLVNQLISWQGAPPWWWDHRCEVATQNKTWGQIKSLYR
jgi:hypothetical protein